MFTAPKSHIGSPVLFIFRMASPIKRDAMTTMDTNTTQRKPAAARKAAKRRAKSPKQRAADRKTKLDHQLEQSGRSDLVWGGRAIGALLGLSEKQVFHLHAKGVFGDAVKKFGIEPEKGEPDKRSLVGVVSKLRALVGV